jgi:O-antigen ligase
MGMGKEQPPWRRSCSAALVLVVLGATYCTGSRGGLLASLAVLGLYVMVRAGVSPRVIFAICALVVTVYSVAPAYLTTIKDQSNSTQYRVEMWAEGLDMIKENPVFGVGRGNFMAHSGKQLIAHNSAVEIGGETGLVGLFLWLSLIYMSIKGAVEYWKSTDDTSHKAFCTALVLGVIAYLISAMFVTLEYETFYLMLALCAVTARSTPNPVSFAYRDAVNVGVIQGVWLIAVQIFVIAYFSV